MGGPSAFFEHTLEFTLASERSFLQKTNDHEKHNNLMSS